MKRWEYIYSQGLRKTEGIDLRPFRRIFGKELFEVYDSKLPDRYRGLLMVEGDRMFLSEKGMDVSNRIMAEFI